MAEKLLIFKRDLFDGVISIVLVPDIWSLSLDIQNNMFSMDKNSIQAGIADKTVSVG